MTSPSAGNGNSPSSAARRSLSPCAKFSLAESGGKTRVSFSGALTVQSLGAMEVGLRNTLGGIQTNVIFDLSGLDSLDTSGALLLNRSAKGLQDKGLDCRMEHVHEKQRQLLEKSVLPEATGKEERSPSPVVPRMLEAVGKTVCETAHLMVQLTGFLGHFLVTVAGLVRRPSRMRWTSLVFHMEQVGLRAVPIVALLTFLIGLVVAYMGAQQLSMFGADIFAVNLLEVTVMREMAVLITAIVVAGRSSSSFTAQIGAMVANEEVAAMRSMGLDPGTLLVVPRVLALVFSLPMLVFVADIMALLGGAVAIRVTIDINFHAFLTQLHDVAKLDNFLVGIIKTPFFAMSIGLVGCFQGFRATGSAESVGFLTTISVVQSIFIVIVLDALFAIFFSNIGM